MPARRPALMSTTPPRGVESVVRLVPLLPAPQGTLLTGEEFSSQSRSHGWLTRSALAKGDVSRPARRHSIFWSASSTSPSLRLQPRSVLS